MPGPRPSVLAALLCSTAAVACSSGTGPQPDAEQARCRDGVVTGPLPAYARAGFRPADRAVAHATGHRGRVVGIVFGAPLSAVGPGTALSGHVNKIRWEARSDGGGGDLRIRASLAGSSRTVTRTVVGGPGSSVIDLPTAGCWRLELSWGREHDTLDLVYRAGEVHSEGSA